MAEIDSSAIGAARKSLGNITYRHRNGKTYASRKITRNSSKSKKQVEQRHAFSATLQMAKGLKAIIDIGFEKTANHTPKNNFMSYNKEIMSYAKGSANYDLRFPAVTNLCIALGDPEFKGKVYGAYGSYDVMTVYNWDEDQNIEARMYFSREFMEGDKITLGLCYSYVLVGSYFQRIKTYTRTLTKEDLKGLAQPDQYKINKETFPNMDVFGELPEGFSDVEIAATAIVVGESDRSTSVFTAMPDMIPELQVTKQELETDEAMDLLVDDPAELEAAFEGSVTGAVLLIPSSGGADSRDDFPIIGFSKDNKNKVNGLKVAPHGALKFMAPLSGSNFGDSFISKDGKKLAVLQGVIYPGMEA